MKSVSNEFLDEIKKFGSEITAEVEFNDVLLDSETLYRLNFIYQTNLFKTILTRVEIESEIEIPINTNTQVRFGLLVGSNYEMVDMGSYKAIEPSTYNADTKTYTTMLHDSMVDTMIKYGGVDIEFPTTHKGFVEAIADRFGWTFNEDYINADTEIDEDFYIGVDMSYRDVLEDLVVATMGNFIVRNNELKLIYPTDTGKTINEEYLNETNVAFGQHYGKVNSLVLSRVETDNIYRQDGESINENGLTELKVSDNMLLSREDRNEWIQPMFDKINGFEYDIFDVSTVGIGIFEPMDIVTVVVGEDTYKVLITNNEFTVTQGLQETLFNEMPDLSVIDYMVADTEDRVFRRAERLVDKQDLIIKDITQRVEGNEESLVEVEQTVDGINSNFLNVTAELTESFAKLGLSFEDFLAEFGKRNGNNLIRNSAMKNGTEYWTKEGFRMYYEQDTPPLSPTVDAYWYVTEDYETYKRGTMYKWTGSEWTETDKKRSDFEETLLQNFSQQENEESRQQTISNSIINVNSKMYDDPYLTHNFGMVHEIPIQQDQEYLTLSIKLNNQILSGNIHFGLSFIPDLLRTQPYVKELIMNLYEYWYMVTPDEHKSMSEIKVTVRVPKLEDVVDVSTTEPEEGYWLDVKYGNGTAEGQLYEKVEDEWERRTNIPIADENGIIWTWRDFYNSYYPTTFTKDQFKPNYVLFAMAHYPGFDITIGNTLPETGHYNQYYALKDDPDPNNNIVYRAKCDGREFKEWERTLITTALIEYMQAEAPLPAPPFPSEIAMPIAGYFQFADLKLEYGTEATLWTGHPDEIYGKNFKLDGTGFYIYSGQNQMFMDEDEIVATYNKETIFQITEELTKLKNLIAGQATIAGLTIRPQVVSGRNLVIIY